MPLTNALNCMNKPSPKKKFVCVLAENVSTTQANFFQQKQNKMLLVLLFTNV